MSKEGEESNLDGGRQRKRESENAPVRDLSRAGGGCETEGQIEAEGVRGDDLKTHLFISRFQCTLPTGAIRERKRDT